VSTRRTSTAKSDRGTGERRLVERFTQVNADTLLYEFTVTIPTRSAALRLRGCR
jgi:hypothetical protein